MTAALTKIYVPRDTTACSLGADRVAEVIQQHIRKHQLALEIVRNGSRGLYWLEPMLEFETEQGRVACGPITPEKADEFMAAACWRNIDKHPLYLGLDHARSAQFARVRQLEQLVVGALAPQEEG